MAEPPDAVFVANSMMTLGAPELLADRRLDIPNAMTMLNVSLPTQLLVRESSMRQY